MPRAATQSGPLRLTPAQARFFALRQPAPAHWNQALMLDVPDELADDTVRDALAAVVAAHDVFRVRVTIGDEGVTQELLADTAAPDAWFRTARVPAGEHSPRWPATTSAASTSRRRRCSARFTRAASRTAPCACCS